MFKSDGFFFSGIFVYFSIKYFVQLAQVQEIGFKFSYSN